jgi:hypothetical protein
MNVCLLRDRCNKTEYCILLLPLLSYEKFGINLTKFIHSFISPFLQPKFKILSFTDMLHLTRLRFIGDSMEYFETNHNILLFLAQTVRRFVLHCNTALLHSCLWAF